MSIEQRGNETRSANQSCMTDNILHVDSLLKKVLVEKENSPLSITSRTWIANPKRLDGLRSISIEKLNRSEKSSEI